MRKGEQNKNRIILIGRLTRDPEIRYSQGENQTAIARYTLVVNRQFRRNGEQEADFISCIAFGKTDEFSEKYLAKGMRVAIEGRLQTGSYTNRDGQKVYTTDVVVEWQEFLEKKPVMASQILMLPEVMEMNFWISRMDEELPFN